MTTRMTGEQRREQLLDATKAIVVEDGFHAVSIEAVARARRDHAADRLRPLRGSAAALLEALVDRESLRALKQLPENFDDLLGALTAYLEAVRNDPDTWRLVLMPQEGAPRLLHERIAAGRAAVVARLAQALPAGSAAGSRAVGAHALGLRRRGRAAHAAGLEVERILQLTRWALSRVLSRNP